MNTITKSFVAISAIACTLHATNGDNLIGLGAKTRAMGGVGIAVSHGAESALANPALISSVKSSEVSFGGTILMPEVESAYGAGYKTSKADLSIAPEIALAHRVNESFVIGTGMWGTAGMGVDYRDAGSNDSMSTTLQLMQFGVPLAYTSGQFSIGVAPLLQYGMLDVKYDNGTGAAGQGASQDFGVGLNAGVAYSRENVTLGAMYKSPIVMHYSRQISQMMNGYGVNGISDTLEQPAEMGVGIGLKSGEHTVGFDYKTIQWSKASGYDTFGWEDQHVYAIGYEYTQDLWALRAGYNYGKSPIREQSVATVLGQTVNLLNLLGFPAIVESHYSIGGSYKFNQLLSLDAAYTYAPEVTRTYLTGTSTSVSTKHSQSTLCAQINYRF